MVRRLFFASFYILTLGVARAQQQPDAGGVLRKLSIAGVRRLRRRPLFKRSLPIRAGIFL